MKKKIVKLIPPHHFTKEESEYIKKKLRTMIKKKEDHNHFLATDPRVNPKVGKTIIKMNKAYLRGFKIVLKNPNIIFDEKHEIIAIYMYELMELISKRNVRENLTLKVSIITKFKDMLENNKTCIAFEKQWQEIMNNSSLKVVK